MQLFLFYLSAVNNLTFSLFPSVGIRPLLSWHPLVIQVNGINVEPCTHEEVVSAQHKFFSLSACHARLLPSRLHTFLAGISYLLCTSATAVHYIHLLRLKAHNERFLMRKRSKKQNRKEKRDFFFLPLAGCHSGSCLGKKHCQPSEVATGRCFF